MSAWKRASNRKSSRGEQAMTNLISRKTVKKNLWTCCKSCFCLVLLFWLRFLSLENTATWQTTAKSSKDLSSHVYPSNSFKFCINWPLTLIRIWHSQIQLRPQLHQYALFMNSFTRHGLSLYFQVSAYIWLRWTTICAYSTNLYPLRLSLTPFTWSHFISCMRMISVWTRVIKSIHGLYSLDLSLCLLWQPRKARHTDLSLRSI